jgi:hypothetical protein
MFLVKESDSGWLESKQMSCITCKSLFGCEDLIKGRAHFAIFKSLDPFNYCPGPKPLLNK